MEKEKAIQILIEFFDENFSEDAAGVGDWFFGKCDCDIEEFVEAIDKMRAIS